MSKKDFHDHEIETKSNNNSFYDSIYNFSVTELEVLRNYINKNFKKKFIKRFKFFAKIFILFVKKSNDNLRLCVNYRDLNVITIKNRYSLFLINENLNKLSKTKIFTKLNMINVFHRIRIKKKTNKKRLLNVDLIIINTTSCRLNWLMLRQVFKFISTKFFMFFLICLFWCILTIFLFIRKKIENTSIEKIFCKNTLIKSNKF